MTATNVGQASACGGLQSATKLTRRTALAAAALAATGCKSAPQHPVSIHKAPAYNQDLYALTRRILDLHKLDLRGKNVVLKPNLVEFDPGAVINTNPLVVHAVYEAVKAAGAASIRIAEGPGHRRVTFEMAEAAGYPAIHAQFEDAFTDLNTDDVTRVTLASAHSSLKELHLPNTILQADLVISLPKLKAHHWVGATLSMKNFFGIVPGSIYGWPKNVLHWAGINESIADIYNTLPPTFAIVDAIDGMEGNGPIQGTKKHVGVLVAGPHLPSVDATCCRIMGIDPNKIAYLQLAGFHPEIPQIGEPIHSAKTIFEMAPNFEALKNTA